MTDSLADRPAGGGSNGFAENTTKIVAIYRLASTSMIERGPPRKERPALDGALITIAANGAPCALATTILERGGDGPWLRAG